MIEDTSFRNIISYKKYKDVYNFKSIEGIVSLIGSICITIILVFVISQVKIDDANTIIRSLTKDIGIAMIGLLGFVVTGLAILTSAISNKIMNIFMKKKKLQAVEKILLSFYLLSFIISSVIVITLIFYIVSFLDYNINLKLLGVITFILSYFIIFILFYSVALVGNCVQIFKIINMIDELNVKNMMSIEDKNIYNSFRITALERLVFLNEQFSPTERINEYKKVMNILIDTECKDELQKKRFKNYMSKFFDE